MRGLLHVLLLIGALMGVAAQGVAFAAEPCSMEQAPPSAMAGMECCPEDTQPQQRHQIPGHDMTLACMAMAGCTALAELAPAAETTAVAEAPTLHFPQTVVVLHGRNVIPEPDPPAILS